MGRPGILPGGEYILYRGAGRPVYPNEVKSIRNPKAKPALGTQESGFAFFV